MRVATLLLLVLLITAAPAAAREAPRTILQDDAQLLFSGAAGREAALDDAVALGGEAVRILARWRLLDAEPAGLDDAVAAVQGRDLDVLLVPTGPAPDRFAACRRRDLPPGACRPSPVAYEAFVADLGRRFASVRSWALWNEPNYGGNLGPQAAGGRLVAPSLYRGLVRAGMRGLRASGHGGDEVLVGETAAVRDASRTRPGLGPTSPGRFLRALLCARCAPLAGTGFGHHPYPRGGSRGPFVASSADELGPSRLGTLAALLRRAHARGRTERLLAVHVTESGFQTLPPDPLLGVPLARQAAHLDGLERQAWGAAASVAQYPIVDERRQGGFQSGLRFTGGRAKPALATFATPAWASCGRVVGRLRPVRAAGVAVALQARGPGGWRTRVVTRTGARGTVGVRLRGRARAWRLAWTDTAGRTHRSRTIDPLNDPRPRGTRC